MSESLDYRHRTGGNKNTQAREYHGLRNQGSTCYLNSVLQVLFMTEDFKEAVGRCPNDCEYPIDHQLNTLFENLTERTGETYKVTQKLGIDKVNEQRDAAEYLEKILTLASDEASKIFKVQLVNRTVCADCDEETDEEKPFWNLPLPLRHSSDENYSVTEAIQEFFKDSHFTKDNQLYCETCQGKRDATIKCIVNNHPEVLMLLLKRFEFDYYQMSYVKNTRVVDVPWTVQIPENQTYELYAFVEHFGSLKSGHYTATIKSQDEDRWYNFNDSFVRELNNPPFQGKKIESSQSAYLLFYRKKGTDEHDNRNASHKGKLLPDNNKNSDGHPNACKSEKDEDVVEGNTETENNSLNAKPMEGPSDFCNIRVHTEQRQPNNDQDNKIERNDQSANQYNGGVRKQNKNGAKKPLDDDNKAGSQGEPDDQVKTRKDEDSFPKRRKTCKNEDGKAGLTGGTSDEWVERNKEKTVQEAKRLSNNKQHPLEQEKHEKQGKYQTNTHVESSSAMQMNHEQNEDVKADYRNKQGNMHSQTEQRTDLKPSQHEIIARQSQKYSSDVLPEERRAKANKQQHVTVKKQDKRKVDEHISSNSLQEKEEKTKSKWSIFKRKKSKNGQHKEVNPNVKESIESNVNSSSEKVSDATVHDFENTESKEKSKEKEVSRNKDNTQKMKAKKENKNISLNCFGKKKK